MNQQTLEINYLVDHIIEKSKLVGEYKLNLEIMEDSKSYEEEEINDYKETISKLEQEIEYYKDRIIKGSY